MSAKESSQLSESAIDSDHSSGQDCNDSKFNYFQGEHDMKSAIDHAEKHYGNKAYGYLFSRAVSSLWEFRTKMKQEDHEIDEQGIAEAYNRYFSLFPPPSTPPEVTSISMGSAAALRALKMLTGLQTESSIITCSSPITPQGSSNNRNAFIGIAMAEASRLFECQEEQEIIASDVDKETTIKEAGKIALKMYLKGYSNHSSYSGDGLMVLASRFLYKSADGNDEEMHST